MWHLAENETRAHEPDQVEVRVGGQGLKQEKTSLPWRFADLTHHCDLTVYTLHKDCGREKQVPHARLVLLTLEADEEADQPFVVLFRAGS